MKTYLSMLLAAVLTLSLAACSVKEKPTTETTAATTVPAQTQETTQAPAETTQPATDPVEETTEETVEETTEETMEPEYPAEIIGEMRLEGEPVEVVMDLFDGGNYVIYIPRDEWLVEYDDSGDFVADTWVNVNNDTVSFHVFQMGSMTPEEAIAYFVENNSDYTFDESDPGVFSGMNMSDRTFMDVAIQSDGVNTFALQTEYYMEMGDGYGTRIKYIMDTFEIK